MRTNIHFRSRSIPGANAQIRSTQPTDPNSHPFLTAKTTTFPNSDPLNPKIEIISLPGIRCAEFNQGAGPLLGLL